jgi:hypothetical protein
VSENPFSQDFSQVAENRAVSSSSSTEDASNTELPKKGNVRRRSSLFTRANTIEEDKVAKFDEKDSGTNDLPTTRARGLSIGTIAKANLLSLSLSDDQANTTTTTTTPSGSGLASTAPPKVSHQGSTEQARRKSFAAQSKPNSPMSVGAENAKRFGQQNNLMRSNSGAQSRRGRANTGAPPPA